MIVLTSNREFKLISTAILKLNSIDFRNWYCPINDYVFMIDAFKGFITSGVCRENVHVKKRWWKLDKFDLKNNNTCHLKPGACFCGADLGSPKAINKDTYDWFLNNIKFEHKLTLPNVNSNDIIIAVIEERATKIYTTEIHFHIGKLCNYDCSYCPPWIHDKTSPHLKLDKFKKALHLLDPHVQLAGMVKLTGGEPMMNPDLVKMIDYTINTMGYKVELATNGTGSISKYKKLLDMGTILHVTFHEGFTIEKNIIKISDLIRYHSNNKLRSRIFVKTLAKENTELYNMIKKIIPDYWIEFLPMYDKEIDKGKQIIEVESC
jgi:organic radical activating enzyme